MNNFSKLATLAAGLGAALAVSTPAHAQQSLVMTSNAIDKCEAFNPSVTNSIRHRVSGAENVGSVGIAVSCAFPLIQPSTNIAQVTNVSEFFLNGDTVPVSVSCSLLPGDYIHGFGDIEGQTVEIMPGEIGSVSFSGPYDTYAIGTNCTIPPKVIIAHTSIDYILFSEPTP